MPLVYWLILFIIGILLRNATDNYRRSHLLSIARRRLLKAMKYVFTIIAVCLFLLPIYYEFPGTFVSRLATFNRDGSIIYHPYGTFCWEWSNDYVNIPLRLGTYSKVHPITDNPKVQFISYSVEIEIANPLIFFSKSDHRVEAGFMNIRHRISLEENVKKIVNRYLAEFNFYHSKELAVFYNPFSGKQQQDFCFLITSYINPILLKEQGLVIKNVVFSLD